MADNLDARKIYMSRNFSITLEHVNRVKEMADELTTRDGKLISEGEVIRRAIDLLYSKTYNEPLPGKSE